MTETSPQDLHFMRIAISLGKRGLGRTGPNPSVGCVIVKNGHVIGRGVTDVGGRPHAEIIAMQQAGREAADATVYVTLEPCSYHGETPPCTEALIKARVSKVVIGSQDPNPEVDGKGIAALRDAGIEVVESVLQTETDALHAAFFSKITRKRPLVTLKMGVTLDGKIASSAGHSAWITNQIARDYGHLLRYRHDAIMVGIETLLNDDPSLTCRLPGLEKYSPTRIIMDSKMRTPESSKVVVTADEIPTYVFTTRDTGGEPRAPAKVRRIQTGSSNTVDIASAIEFAATELDISSILLEGGSVLAASFLRDQLVDRVEWIQAPGFIGSLGVSAIGNAGSRVEQAALDNEHHFEITEQRMLGDNQLTVLERIVA